MILTNGNKGSIIPEMNDALLSFVVDFIKKHPDEVLQMPYICMALAAMRIDALKEDDINIKNMSASRDLIENAIEHNLNGLKGKSTLVRPMLLTTILRSIGYVGLRMKNVKVLTIGPRTESEIFLLIAAGFDPVNITGIDLMSYSPLIDVGDMHDLPYEDDSFDVIIMGWVLAYSKDPVKAVREARRVAKKDAVFAIGCEYSPYTVEELNEQGSILSDDAGRYEKAKDIHDLFEGDVGTVWFQDDIHPDMKKSRGNVMTVFQRNLEDATT